jgi:predicted nucleic acid-binding protein
VIVAGIVVDASVAVKWLIDEDRSAAAQDLRNIGGDLIAPSSVIFEVYHAVWDAARTGRTHAFELEQMQAIIPAFFQRLVPMATLFDEAADLARTLRHPIYDCAYLALARREDIEVITADRDMARAGRRARIRTRVL